MPTTLTAPISSGTEPVCLASSPLFAQPDSATSTETPGRRTTVFAALAALAVLVGGLAVFVSQAATAAGDGVVGSAILADGTVTVSADGSTATLGAVPYASRSANDSIGVASSSSGDGYWVVTANGVVSAYGAVETYGDASGLPLGGPIVGIAATPSGKGYWLVGDDGGVFAYGDAGFYGSAASLPLNDPIVGIAATPSGKGYWLVATDGGVFAYGDAGFYGSALVLALNDPIVGIAATPSGNGYWLAAADGGVFAYGDGSFFGSIAGDDELVVDIDATSTGYLLTAADGDTIVFQATGVDRQAGSDDSSSSTNSGSTDSGSSSNSSSSSSSSGSSSNGSNSGADDPDRSISGWPDATNTGVTDESLLRPSGSITVTQSGAVIENLDVSGSISVRAPNVTIRNVRVSGSASHLIRNYSRNLLVVDVTLAGERPCAAGIAFNNYTARRVNTSGCADGLKANLNTVIEDSYIHDLRKWSGTHNDGIQGTGGSNVVIRNNRIEGPYRGSVSAIKMDSFNNHLDNLTIEDNLISGGGYSVYVTKFSGMRAPTNIRVVDNVFVEGTMTWDWRIFDRSSSQVWSGNRWDDGTLASGQ